MKIFFTYLLQQAKPYPLYFISLKSLPLYPSYPSPSYQRSQARFVELPLVDKPTEQCV